MFMQINDGKIMTTKKTTVIKYKGDDDNIHQLGSSGLEAVGEANEGILLDNSKIQELTLRQSLEILPPNKRK